LPFLFSFSLPTPVGNPVQPIYNIVWVTDMSPGLSHHC